MHPAFASLAEKLHPKFERLVAMAPIRGGVFPSTLPKAGIYLLSESDTHLYVGRSRDLTRRYKIHSRVGSAKEQASFAFLLARRETKFTQPVYKNGEGTRAWLMNHQPFVEAFASAKARIREMDFRCVEEEDDTRQALLEIYCAVALSTPFNNFATS